MQICSINHRITQLLSSSELTAYECQHFCLHKGWWEVGFSLSARPGVCVCGHACVRVGGEREWEVLTIFAFLQYSRLYFLFVFTFLAVKELSYSANPDTVWRNMLSPGI